MCRIIGRVWRLSFNHIPVRTLLRLREPWHSRIVYLTWCGAPGVRSRRHMYVFRVDNLRTDMYSDRLQRCQQAETHQQPPNASGRYITPTLASRSTTMRAYTSSHATPSMVTRLCGIANKKISCLEGGSGDHRTSHGLVMPGPATGRPAMRRSAVRGHITAAGTLHRKSPGWQAISLSWGGCLPL